MKKTVFMLLYFICGFNIFCNNYLQSIVWNYSSLNNKHFIYQTNFDSSLQVSNENNNSVKQEEGLFQKFKKFIDNNISWKSLIILTIILLVLCVVSIAFPPLFIIVGIGFIIWLYILIGLVWALPWLKILFWIGFISLSFYGCYGVYLAVEGITNSLAAGITACVIGVILAIFLCISGLEDADTIWYFYYIVIVASYFSSIVTCLAVYFIFIFPFIKFKSAKEHNYKIPRIAERLVADSYYIEKCSKSDRDFYMQNKIVIDELAGNIKKQKLEKQKQEQDIEHQKQLQQIEEELKIQESQAKQDDEAAKLKRHLNNLPERIRFIGRIEKTNSNDEILVVFDQIENTLRDIEKFKEYISNEDISFIKRQKKYFEAELEDAKENFIENKVFLIHKEGITELFLSLENN